MQAPPHAEKAPACGTVTTAFHGIVAGIAEQVQRPAAAVAEQDVVAQVVTDHQAAHEMLAHEHVHEVDTLLGGDIRVEPERIGDLLA